MKLRVLALDHDAMVAADDRVDADLAAAIRDLRRAGVKMILTCGRRLVDLPEGLATSALFDAVVAEGGAVVHVSNGARPTLLGRGPAPALLHELRRCNLSYRPGLRAVETHADAAPAVFAVLQAHGAPCAVTFDDGTLRVLPHGVSKASGLREAAWRLGVSLHNAVAIGGAHDDQPMLDACEIGLAVAWGSSALQQSADEVVAGAGPAALADYLRTLAVADPIPPRRRPGSPWRLRVGTRATGEPVELDIRLGNVLFTGDPRSGKTWIASLLCERLVLHRYALCVVDPEGDYACLGALPGVVVHRVREDEDWLPAVERILRQPSLSVVVDLSHLTSDGKRAAVRSLLRTVDSSRRALGTPHLVVVDEAHYFVERHENPDVVDPTLGGWCLVTYRPADLPAGLLENCDRIVATRIADPRTAGSLLALTHAAGSPADWCATLANLTIGEAVLLPASPDDDQGVLRFTLEPRVTEHVRHRGKYVDVGVPAGREFVFTRHGGATGLRARTLRELVETLPLVADDVLAGHLARGDFHRWIEDVIGDYELGETIRTIEDGDVGNAREAMSRAVRDRYVDAATEPPDRTPSPQPVRGCGTTGDHVSTTHEESAS